MTQGRERGKFRAPFDAWSVANIPREVLGNVVVDGQIRFEYGYVWTWKVFNPERNSCGFKNIWIRVDKA